MADEIKSPEVEPAKELTRAEIIKAYYDATKDERTALFIKYPVLKTIFSEGNHT